MSCSGAGRGRGWLNLNKNNPGRPGGPSPTISQVNTHTINGISQETEGLTMNSFNSQYEAIVTLLEHLDVNDDGILLNQKIRHINEEWESKCNSKTEIEESFKYVYVKCLQDMALATKLLLMVSSFTPAKNGIHATLKSLFIKQLQIDFENSKHTQSSNVRSFRNSVRMLGEFYNKGRLSDGSTMSFLAGPMVQYFQMLLDSAQPADLELFTSQLYLNGASIQAECAQEIQGLLMQVRRLMINGPNLIQNCKVWLLLALDVVYHRFGLLPSELHKFYQEQLGDKAMANFQGIHGMLSIQTTYSSKTLDEYQSTVNVLQVTPPNSISPSVEQNVNSHILYNMQDDVKKSYNNSKDYNSQSFNSDCDNWRAKDNKRNDITSGEKMGRPILGAGARLQRNQPRSDDDSIKWRDHSKENSTGWDKKKIGSGKSWDDNNQKSHRSGNKVSRKWGEHDDRFDTDY